MIGHALRVLHSHVRELVKRHTRSPEWGRIEKAFRKLHPTCAACGGSSTLQVHHKRPFHLRPELELDLTNLITLCMGSDECHLRIGHGGNWSAYNPLVVTDAAHFRHLKQQEEKLVGKCKTRRLTA